MTAPRRPTLSDPTDRPESYQITLAEITPGQRARARLQVALAGHDRAERQELLAALGLDDPAEITTQLAHRHQGDAA